MTLKIGNNMEITVANTTKIVLHISLEKLMLRSNFLLPRVRALEGILLLQILMIAHNLIIQNKTDKMT